MCLDAVYYSLLSWVRTNKLDVYMILFTEVEKYPGHLASKHKVNPINICDRQETDRTLKRVRDEWNETERGSMEGGLVRWMETFEESRFETWTDWQNRSSYKSRFRRPPSEDLKKKKFFGKVAQELWLTECYEKILASGRSYRNIYRIRPDVAFLSHAADAEVQPGTILLPNQITSRRKTDWFFSIPGERLTKVWQKIMDANVVPGKTRNRGKNAFDQILGRFAKDKEFRKSVKSPAISQVIARTDPGFLRAYGYLQGLKGARTECLVTSGYFNSTGSSVLEWKEKYLGMLKRQDLKNCSFDPNLFAWDALATN